MELIDTPNQNAKGCNNIHDDEIMKSLNGDGISSCFLGIFITITKYDNVEWELITQDIATSLINCKHGNI